MGIAAFQIVIRTEAGNERAVEYADSMAKELLNELDSFDDQTCPETIKEFREDLRKLVGPELEVSRRAFEAWVSDLPYEHPVDRYPDEDHTTAWPGQYRKIEVQLAWEAWCEASGIFKY